MIPPETSDQRAWNHTDHPKDHTAKAAGVRYQIFDGWHFAILDRESIRSLDDNALCPASRETLPVKVAAARCNRINSCSIYIIIISTGHVNAGYVNIAFRRGYLYWIWLNECRPLAPINPVKRTEPGTLGFWCDLRKTMCSIAVALNVLEPVSLTSSTVPTKLLKVWDQDDFR